MKRLLAFVFVVTLAFSFAGSASAFSWEKPAQPTPEKIGYSIDVLKCTLVTGAAGSYYYNVDDNAVAVNGADVYWAVKLTVDGPSDLIKSTASCIYTQKVNKKIRKPQAVNQTALIFARRVAARLLSINSIRRLCWS